MGMAANQMRLMSLTARQSDLELRAQQISAAKMALAQASSAAASAYTDALYKNSLGGISALSGTYAQYLTNHNYVITSNDMGTSFEEGNTAARFVNIPADATKESLTLYNYICYKKTVTTTENPETVIVPPSEEPETLTATEALALLTVEPTMTTFMNIIMTKGNWLGINPDEFTNIVNATTFENGTYTIDGNNNLKYAGVSGATFTLADLGVAATGSGSGSGSGSTTTTTTKVTYAKVTLPDDTAWTKSEPSTGVDMTAAQAEYDSEMTSLSAQEKLYDMELTQINTEHTAVKTEYDAVKQLISDNVEKSFNVFG